MNVIDKNNERGGFSYLQNGVSRHDCRRSVLKIPVSSAITNHLNTFKEADLVVGVVVQTSDRFKIVDFIHPWAIDPYYLIIPYPKTSSNGFLTRIAGPWSYEVFS